MSDTPETDAFMTRIRGIDGDKHWVPVNTARRLERERNEVQAKYDTLAAENMLEVHKLCKERDEAQRQSENLKLQLGLWEDGNLICEETLGEIRLLEEQIKKTLLDRDEAIELLKEASAYSNTASQKNTEKFLRKINKWEGAK